MLLIEFSNKFWRKAWNTSVSGPFKSQWLKRKYIYKLLSIFFYKLTIFSVHTKVHLEREMRRVFFDCSTANRLICSQQSLFGADTPLLCLNGKQKLIYFKKIRLLVLGTHERWDFIKETCQLPICNYQHALFFPLNLLQLNMSLFGNL